MFGLIFINFALLAIYGLIRGNLLKYVNETIATCKPLLFWN